MAGNSQQGGAYQPMGQSRMAPSSYNPYQQQGYGQMPQGYQQPRPMQGMSSMGYPMAYGGMPQQQQPYGYGQMSPQSNMFNQQLMQALQGMGQSRMGPSMLPPGYNQSAQTTTPLPPADFNQQRMAQAAQQTDGGVNPLMGAAAPATDDPMAALLAAQRARRGL